MLPPTPLLKAGGIAAGVGLGHALGSVFDAPRRALTNALINPLAHGAVAAATDPDGDGDEHHWSIASMLPGAAGLAAGGMAAFLPGMQPFAPAIGAGVAGLGQMLGEAIDPHTFHAPTTGELVKTLGADPDSAGGQGLSMGLGVLTDPLTYAGGFEGALGGEALGGARDALAERAARLGELSDRAEGLGRLQGMAEGAVKDFEGASAHPLVARAAEDLARGPNMQYRQDVLDALPSLDELRRAGPAKLYKRVDPGLSQDLNLLGLGVPGEGGSVNLPLGRAPAFAESRGGWLKPSRAREAMLAGEEPLAHPSLLGPSLDRSAGPEALLTDPVGEYRKLRGESEGLGPMPSGLPRRAPRLAEALGGDVGESLYSDPHAMIDDFPVQPMMATDPVARVKGNVGSLPLYDARDKIGSMLSDALRQRDALAGVEPTRLQAALQRLGLAPR